jgi:thiol:disulfide interchange protein DsbC
MPLITLEVDMRLDFTHYTDNLKESVMKKISLALGLLLLASLSNAADLSAFQKKAQAALSAIDARYVIGSVEEAGVTDFYRVTIVSGPTLYMPASADYFFSGDLFQMTATRFVNLTEQAEGRERKELMAQLNPAEMIVFSPRPPVMAKAHITVFTDIDCGYCQKLHQEVPALNAMGIEVRYMAFPRAGLGSPSYDKLVSAWCSSSQTEALTALKQRQQVPQQTCENPVAAQYEMGQKMGVTGTPAIFLEDGRLIPGYRPAKALAKELGI